MGRLMVIRTAPRSQALRRQQAGVALIELMIGALLAVMVIGMVGSVFLAAQRIARQQAQQLILSQNLASSLALLKEGVERAGYNGIEPDALRLSGAEQVLYVDSSQQQLGYVYRNQAVGDEAFYHAFYRLEALTPTVNALKLCEKFRPEILTPAMAAQSGVSGFCFSLFDEQMINVAQFHVEPYRLVGAQAQRLLIKLTIRAQLIAQPAISQQASLILSANNWR